MPHTYTNLWYHLVFGTKDRLPLIEENWRKRLHAYLGGTIRGMGGVASEINGVADHVHLLVSLKPTHELAKVLQELKADSSLWVHKQGLSAEFAWQRGYGAFTVSSSQLENVRRYLVNQEEHHRKMTFEEEYKALLKAHGIEFDERYLWS